MTKQALKALKSSIAHWERLSRGNRNAGEGIGIDFCALCKIFHKPWGQFCIGCPVMERTGQSGCVGTPYGAAYSVRSKGLDSPEFKSAAKKELEFLKSLLPKGK